MIKYTVLWHCYAFSSDNGLWFPPTFLSKWRFRVIPEWNYPKLFLFGPPIPSNALQLHKTASCAYGIRFTNNTTWLSSCRCPWARPWRCQDCRDHRVWVSQAWQEWTHEDIERPQSWRIIRISENTNYTFVANALSSIPNTWWPLSHVMLSHGGFVLKPL